MNLYVASLVSLVYSSIDLSDSGSDIDSWSIDCRDTSPYFNSGEWYHYLESAYQAYWQTNTKRIHCFHLYSLTPLSIPIYWRCRCLCILSSSLFIWVSSKLSSIISSANVIIGTPSWIALRTFQWVLTSLVYLWGLPHITAFIPFRGSSIT